MKPLRGLLATLLLVGLGGVTLADEVPPLTPEEQKLLLSGVSKRGIEAPLKSAFRSPLRYSAKGKDGATRSITFSKGKAERPVRGPAVLRPSRNGRVTPGAVDWHRSFADAKRAASKSGKPVLLFQLLGRLDEAFC